MDGHADVQIDACCIPAGHYRRCDIDQDQAEMAKAEELILSVLEEQGI